MMFIERGFFYCRRKQSGLATPFIRAKPTVMIHRVELSSLSIMRLRRSPRTGRLNGVFVLFLHISNLRTSAAGGKIVFLVLLSKQRLHITCLFPGKNSIDLRTQKEHDFEVQNSSTNTTIIKLQQSMAWMNSFIGHGM